MSSALSTLLHSLQALFGAYNLYLCSISISKLRGYEDASKKAASWSDTAAEQLRRTRSTQASGVLAILFSTLSSIATAALYSESRTAGAGIAAVNVVVLMAARAHVGGFWKGGKGRIPVPGAGGYNDAVARTREVRLNSAYLAVGWVVGGVLALL